MGMHRTPATSDPFPMVVDMLYNGRPLPADEYYRDLEPKAQALANRIPMHSPHRALLCYILHHAQLRRADAAYGGAHNDGGASELESQVELFIDAVINRNIPKVWKEYAQQLALNGDPEYAQYLELAKKFGPLK